MAMLASFDAGGCFLVPGGLCNEAHLPAPKGIDFTKKEDRQKPVSNLIEWEDSMERIERVIFSAKKRMTELMFIHGHFVKQLVCKNLDRLKEAGRCFLCVSAQQGNSSNVGLTLEEKKQLGPLHCPFHGQKENEICRKKTAGLLLARRCCGVLPNVAQVIVGLTNCSSEEDESV
ncbi:hypothetical protein H6P81_012233 [Aristolochia fimbriata]|uniref:Uncharacterized protein n=1 Tax=Aristolochia fimbriata TaxID=158543 RepID=A0AAV7EB89_ARIFI|nr:hypothetical protein H6P81_012233 [Aristolochia fimbriata]